VALALHTLEVAVVVAVTVQDKVLVAQVVVAMVTTHHLLLAVIILAEAVEAQVTQLTQTELQLAQTVVQE
jgi:hypothetical protein